MKRILRIIAAIIMLSMLCGALAEEEIVSEMLEPQFDEVELALGDGAAETEVVEEPEEDAVSDDLPEPSVIPAETLPPDAEAILPEETATPADEEDVTLETDLAVIAEDIAAPTDTPEPTETPVPTAEPNRLPQDPQTVTLGVKEKRKLPGFDAVASATYISSKPKVVSVSADGTVKGRKRGSAAITVSTPDGQSCSVAVKVLSAPTKLRLSAKKLALEAGDAVRLNAKFKKMQGGAVSFTSSNPGVARVDGDGLVTAAGPGSAVITARSYNGKKAKCKVSVAIPAAEIDLPEEVHLAIREKAGLACGVSDVNGAAYGGPVKTTLSPKGIASFKNGRLTGKKAGVATLTVQAGKLSKTCRVVVEAYASAHPVQSIAHRGSAHWQENTLEAFRNFASTGADGVELDARSTKDGVQVIFHDPSFTANGTTYVIAEQTCEAIRAANPSICTLDEALDVLEATGKSVHLEFKETADGAKCVRAVRAHGLQARTVYFSFFTDPLKQAYEADPSAKYGLSLKASAKPTSKAVMEKARKLHVSFFVAHKKLINRKVVDFWHDRGYRISVWTVNDMPTVQKLCALGVDYILSDYPEYCVQARS